MNQVLALLETMCGPVPFVETVEGRQWELTDGHKMIRLVWDERTISVFEMTANGVCLNESRFIGAPAYVCAATVAYFVDHVVVGP